MRASRPASRRCRSELRVGTDDASEAARVIWHLNEVGVTITQKEEFFIDRLPPREERVEVVEDPQQVAA